MRRVTENDIDIRILYKFFVSKDVDDALSIECSSSFSTDVSNFPVKICQVSIDSNLVIDDNTYRIEWSLKMLRYSLNCQRLVDVCVSKHWRRDRLVTKQHAHK